MRRLLPLLALALLATPASADVVQSPPDDCPSGAMGRTNHYGPHCAPDVCDPAAEEACTTGSYPPRPAGRACREAAFCVTTRTNMDCRSVRPFPTGGTSRTLSWQRMIRRDVGS